MTEPRKHGNGGNYPMGIQKSEKSEKPKIESKQLEQFQYSHNQAIQPPLEPSTLINIVQESDSLGQLIEAVASNIANYGIGIRYVQGFDYNQADEKTKAQADAEWVRLERLYKYMSPFVGLQKVIHDAVYDRECIGYGLIEVIRNGIGEVAQMEYCRAANVRLVNNKDNKTAVKVWMETEKGFEQIEIIRKFKKFVQSAGGNKVYFKEFGDPRMMNCRSGEYKDDVAEADLATELMYIGHHNPASDYGLPRWTGPIVDILGNREASELNLNYFKNGKILPCAIVVNNGQLTVESEQAIKNGSGVNNAYGWLVIEGAGFENVTDGKVGSTDIEIDIKPLTDTQNSDAQFMGYQKSNKEKVRSTFRVAPIYTGDSADYNRATVDAAKQTTEEQVFQPDRMTIANLFNFVINNEIGIRYCEMYLLSPEIGDKTELSKALAPYIAKGVVTLNMLIPALEKLLGISIEPFPEEIGNLPFDLVKMAFQTKLQAGNQAENIQKSAGGNVMDMLMAAVIDLKGVIDDSKED